MSFMSSTIDFEIFMAGKCCKECFNKITKLLVTQEMKLEKNNQFDFSTLSSKKYVVSKSKQFPVHLFGDHYS